MQSDTTNSMKDDAYEFRFTEDMARSSDFSGRLNISGKIQSTTIAVNRPLTGDVRSDLHVCICIT